MVRGAKALGAPAVAIVALLMLLAAPQASAATYSVNTTGDPVGAGCAGGTCSLRQALNVVNAGSGGDRIVLPAGRIVLNGTVLSVSKPVTITGAGARASIVDANNGSTIMTFGVGASPSAVEEVTLTGGRASQTGGISNSGTLRLTAVSLAGNVAFGNVAGGILNNTGANLTVERSTISGNTAGTIGGAIYNSDSATVTITNSTIAGNTANTAGSNWEGGGVYTDGTVTILNSTVVNNRAFRGAGIDVPSGRTAILKNTIVANNTATGVGQPGNCRIFGTLTSQGSNLEDTNTCSFAQAGDLPNTPSVLGPPQDNGGSTDTLALLAGSSAIDRGNATGCPATDQRGVGRPQQGDCDIGAYELGPPSVTTSGASGVGVTRASVAGTLLANLRATTYWFEYGPTTAYGSATAAGAAGSGISPVPVSAALGGLKAATTYHYRLGANNVDGTSKGADLTFRTGPFTGSRLASKRLRVDRRGNVTLRVACPAGIEGGSCRVVAALHAPRGKLPASASARRSRRAKLLGRGRFSVAAGKTLRKRLRLNKAGRKLARKRRGFPARLLITTKDAVPNTDTTRYRVTVRGR
jgi:hypothetical protein